MSEQLNLVNEHYKCFKMWWHSLVLDPESSSFTKSNICSTERCCHMPSSQLLLTTISNSSSKIFWNGTAGEDSFPGRSMIAIGACIMMLFSPVGKRARNMSSSVYGLRGVLLSKKRKKKGEKMHLVISSTEYKFWMRVLVKNLLNNFTLIIHNIKKNYNTISQIVPC